MSEAEAIMPEFLAIVDNSIDRSIVDYDYRLSRSDLITLFTNKFQEKSNFSEVLDLCFFYGFMDANDKSKPVYDKYYVTLRGREFLLNPELFWSSDTENLNKIRNKIDSTDWTGLGKQMSDEHTNLIREKSQALLLAIMQSDANIQTRTNACKRVEAAIVLLEAPDVPWREIMELLSHPTVSSFLAALSLIQFIIGVAH